MDQRYMSLSQVPHDAMKPITIGKLKGKSDINPQWRYEAMTEVFGLCGEGWKFEITNTVQVPVPATGELMIFVFLNLYIKGPDGWSAPIPGSGGDFLIIKDKNGIHGNDEAYKMATTDALGTAAKMVGVAASIYRGTYRTKYERQAESYARDNRVDAKTPQPQPKPQPQLQHPTQKMINELEILCQKNGRKIQDMLTRYHFKTAEEMDMTTYWRTYNTLKYVLGKTEAKA